MKAPPEVLWPVERFVELAAAWVRLTTGCCARTPRSALADAPAAIADWIESAVSERALQAEHLHVPQAELGHVLALRRPALIRITADGRAAVAAVVRVEGSKLCLLTPAHEIAPLAPADLALLLQRWRQRAVATPLEAWLEHASIPPARRARLRDTLQPGRLALDLWVLRDRLTLTRELSEVRVVTRLGGSLGMHALGYALWLLSWGVLGAAALRGHADPGWLTGWSLLIATWIWLRVVAATALGRLLIDVGTCIKRRLLHSTLALDPQLVRERGAGYFLGHVLESHSLEALALSGGSNALIAFAELAIACFVLLAGAGGWWSFGALLATLALGAHFSMRLNRNEMELSAARAALTSATVERMVGYRTRLAQEPPSLWHRAEDAELDGYRALLERTDRVLLLVHVCTPEVWLVLGLASLTPAVLLGSSMESLAVGLGGVLIVYRSLRRLVAGAGALIAARVAWLRVAPLLTATRLQSELGTDVEPAADRSVRGLEVRALTYRYPTRPTAAVSNWSLKIAAEERVWLDAPSAAGKSTLVSLLSAIRSAQSGLMLFAGLDRHALGARRWRRHIAAVPQFHENHVLSGSLAFNLLLGRRWPPLREDLEEAAQVCCDLGLDEVISRMPSGLQQMLGETGWQLSHGERSRLFIARALLQRADVIVLDESLAGLDAQTIEKVMQCLARRAPSLLLVAHP